MERMIRDLDLGKKGKKMHEDVQRADVYSLVDKLDRNKELTKDEFIFLIDNRNYLNLEELYQRARDIRHKIYGHDVYLRGLIEFTSYCHNDCYYCGIRKRFPDCAITLSVGETTKDNYKMWYDAGAERYLLRHETANEEHYRRLHPEYQKLSNRMECLYNLRDIGYQVGAGFMIGSPYQT
jgi:biotin synthase